MIIGKDLSANILSNHFTWFGGPLFILITGEFDGATVQLFATQDNLPPLALDEGAFTQPTYVELLLPQAGQILFEVSGVGALTNITISAQGRLKEEV